MNQAMGALIEKARAAAPSALEASGERGSDVLEFAFVMTLLLTLLMGLFTFARGYNIYQTALRAAREGARMAVLPNCASCGNTYLDASSGVTEASSAVFNNYISPALRASALNPNSVESYSETVGWLNGGDTEAHCGVIISFQYPYQLVLPFTKTNLTTINLPIEVQMRRENQPILGGTCP